MTAPTVRLGYREGEDAPVLSAYHCLASLCAANGAGRPETPMKDERNQWLSHPSEVRIRGR
jgi:hypothetical protein